MDYTGQHTRQAPNGYGGAVWLTGGKGLEDLCYRDQVAIRLSEDGPKISAVVDLLAPNFWRGPKRAFADYDAGLGVTHLFRVIVWQRIDGGWDEFRSTVEATEEEFLRWRGEFDGDNPPTPTPEA